MKRLFFLLIPALFLLTACGDDKDALPPEGVLSEDEMVAVMVDIQLIEGAYHKRVIKSKNTRKDALDGYVMVYDKYNITQAQFDSSYSWYLDDPHRMDKVLERVLQELSEMQAKQQAELE